MRFRRRLIFLYAVFCCAMGIVWLRATQLQIIDGDVWAEAAQDMRERTEVLPALRGPIVSADGVVLAEDAPVFQLAIYHQSGRRRANGKLKLRFPSSCACARKARRTVGVDAYPRTQDAEEKPRLERLPLFGGLPRDLALIEP